MKNMARQRDQERAGRSMSMTTRTANGPLFEGRRRIRRMSRRNCRVSDGQCKSHRVRGGSSGLQATEDRSLLARALVPEGIFTAQDGVWGKRAAETEARG